MAKSSAVTGRTSRAGTRGAAHGHGEPEKKAPAARGARSAARPAARPAPVGDVEAAPRRKPAARRGEVRLPRPVAGAVKAALDKKAEDVVVLDLRKAGGFTDFFIICTGGNPRQIAAIADSVRESLKRDFGERPALSEGIDRSEWILLDYFNFVVHVFSRDCRAFYGLERLWGNAERLEISDASAQHA